MGTRSFLLIMGLSSAVTLLRGFVLAAILDIGDFGLYAVTIGSVAFCGILVSVGSIEATWKVFPRLWVRGLESRIVQQSRAIDLRLTLRSASATMVVTTMAWAIGRPDLMVTAALAGS